MQTNQQSEQVEVTQAQFDADQQRRREALVERLLKVADLCCDNPLPGELGDVAYDLLREAAARIASDRLRFARISTGENTEAAVAEAVERTTPSVSGEAREPLPDIGVEPLTLPRPREWEDTLTRIKGPMVVQQKGVPHGTALVWRTDLLDMHHRLIRMTALAELRGEKLAETANPPTAQAASPADDGDRAGEGRYRHNARGTEYDLIGTAELQDATGNGVEEGALLAIYRGDDGKLWARRHREFGDGRFTRLSTPTPAQADGLVEKHNSETMRLRAVICAIIEAVEDEDSDAMTAAMDDARSEVVLSACRTSSALQAKQSEVTHDRP